MRNYWSLKLSEVAYFLVLISFSTQAQFSAPDDAAPTGSAATSYVFPIEPGKTAMLTGTMGELRNTHFHGGLDINTPTIGYEVRSAQEGYIARATTSTSGYGNALYIKHLDGNTTLYAHLHEFRGALATHVRQQRYLRKQSELDLNFAPGQFPVGRGEVVAISGNTGSSGGPHLHFEVRNEANEALNPLVAGFAEVKDNIAPLVQKIALRTLHPTARINDQFGRFEFYVVKRGNDYVLPAPILASGAIGLEVLAHDKQENSRFKFGINLIEVFSNGQRVFVQTIDKIKFSENRGILALMDYRALEISGQRFNKLYVDEGNRLGYYEGTLEPRGLTVDGGTRDIELRLTDYFGNSTRVQLTLQHSPPSPAAPFLTAAKSMAAEVWENTLKITTKGCPGSDTLLQVHTQGKQQQLAASYGNEQSRVFLIDWRKVRPDSVRSCGESWVSNWVDVVPSGTPYKYFSAPVEIEFPERALYDTLALRVTIDSLRGEQVLTVGSGVVPLFAPIRIACQPGPRYVPQRNTGVYRKEGRGYAYLGNEFRNGRFHFNSLAFGEFVVLQDSIAPSIKPISLNPAVARLRIGDNLSGISYFEANINGQWLLMNYDYKSGILYSERLDPAKPLQGEFELKVVDQAGNESIFKQKI